MIMWSYFTCTERTKSFPFFFFLEINNFNALFYVIHFQIARSDFFWKSMITKLIVRVGIYPKLTTKSLISVIKKQKS